MPRGTALKNTPSGISWMKCTYFIPGVATDAEHSIVGGRVPFGGGGDFIKNTPFYFFCYFFDVTIH